ncbi:MAG: hypothetical protein IJ189_08390 [Clostridia bacterium]|nr:hypothetical protein [Clostridia bacterium]
MPQTENLLPYTTVESIRAQLVAAYDQGDEPSVQAFSRQMDAWQCQLCDVSAQSIAPKAS